MVDHVFELVEIVLEETLHRPRGGITERADRVALNFVGYVEQAIEVFQLALPVDNPVPSRQGVHWPQDSAM